MYPKADGHQLHLKWEPLHKPTTHRQYLVFVIDFFPWIWSEHRTWLIISENNFPSSSTSHNLEIITKGNFFNSKDKYIYFTSYKFLAISFQYSCYISQKIQKRGSHISVFSEFALAKEKNEKQMKVYFVPFVCVVIVQKATIPKSENNHYPVCGILNCVLGTKSGTLK